MCSWFVGCVLCALYACSFTTVLMQKEKAAMTFTESQNSRGWKGPLWVI